jgi:hypothetical protein
MVGFNLLGINSQSTNEASSRKSKGVVVRESEIMISVLNSNITSVK